MRLIVVILFISIVFTGCVRNNKVPAAAQDASNPSMHKVKVVEVIQSSNYTYMKVDENGKENWIAVNRQEAAAGETYYYDQALEMSNFSSKELGRTFETIYFVQDISNQPIQAQQMQAPANHSGRVAKAQMTGISVAPAEGSVSIAQLYKSRNDYSGKKIKMKGQVVKVNEQVMSKNWIHIQDGTDDNGNFDLTITTQDLAAIGDVVTFEGTITLNKDFSHGYVYELIMEDATLVK